MTAETRILALRWARQDMVPYGTALPPERARDVIHTAQVYYRWLEGPTRMFLTIAIEGDTEMPLTVDSTNAVAIL